MNKTFRCAGKKAGLAAISLMILIGLSANTYAQAPKSHAHLMQTQFPTDDFVVASAVVTEAPYNAHPDGKTDCTQAIQSAIDAVAAIGGGEVYLPSGRYLCAGSLALKGGVTIRGDWKAPTKMDCKVAGTVLMPTGGRGQADAAPFVSMQSGSGVRDLSIWYPDQHSQNITPYPWTLAIDPNDPQIGNGPGDSYTVEQVTLVNPYQAIRIGPTINELSTIRQVYGTPLKTGIWIDFSTDISRLELDDFSPKYWVGSGLDENISSGAVRNYVYDHGTAITLLRADWEYIFDFTAEGYNVGLSLQKSVNGFPGGVMYGGGITGGQIGIDAVNATDAFQFANCKFDGKTAAVVEERTIDTAIGFDNCRLGGEANCVLRLDGYGKTNLQNCTLIKHGTAAIEATHGYLTMLASPVVGTGKSIFLGPWVARAIVVGSVQPSQVASRSYGTVQIDPKPIVSAKPAVQDVALDPGRKPATDRLFDVTDYGAHGDYTTTAASTDNTSPFQAALDAAGKAGGGTVYIPAGSYLFKGNLNVPTGVELRGCSDVPHHTITWGSVLMPTSGRGSETATPFINLASHSGARGLLIWYPDQKVDDIVPYPWSVQSHGPGCWLIDFTGANSYQLADFGSYPNNDHLLRYVAGAPLRRGVYVSKGTGDVDECMFNAHYWMRHPTFSPPISNAPNGNSAFWFFNLEAYIVGNCPHETQVDNFVCCDRIGLHFIDDHGGASGTFINPGADGANTGILAEAAAPAGLQIINSESADVINPRTGIEVTSTCTGPVSFFNGNAFGDEPVPSALLMGKGPLVMQDWLIQQSGVKFGGDQATLQGFIFPADATRQLDVVNPSARLSLVGCTAHEDTFVVPQAASVRAHDNGKALPPIPYLALNDHFSTVADSAQALPTPVVSISENNASLDCKLEPTTSSGKGGEITMTEMYATPGVHTYVYYKLADVNFTIQPNTVLRYKLMPSTTSGAHTGVDLAFSDGTFLRQAYLHGRWGGGMHPGDYKGAPGKWTTIECPIGEALAGKKVTGVLYAYDEWLPGGPVKSTLSAVEIGEPKG